MYLWLYVLGIGGLLSLLSFILSIKRDSKLLRKLKLPKGKIIVNWLLLLVSIGCFSLLAYLFINIQQQINLLGL